MMLTLVSKSQIDYSFNYVNLLIRLGMRTIRIEPNLIQFDSIRLVHIP